MKNILFATAAFVCMTLMAPSCKKGSSTTTPTYRAKVIYLGCGHGVIDIEGTNGLGKKWTYQGTDYTNAVDVADYCYYLTIM
jgi:hypothetical protein